MRKKLTMLLASLFLVLGTAWAQAPQATPTEAITGLLNRIGGNGAADKFEIVIDANLAENGNDVFVITSQNGKPCIKGNTQLSVATGVNWYLNHHAHVNLTWNNLTTDLSKVTLPVPTTEEKHVCNAPYRYDFNTCTFSYSMAFWTWERWQQEIDWMALHGINAPLNLVGLEVVTRNFLEELGVSETDIDNYIAGPGFMAWFAMNNLEGWGSTINAKDVTMNGNPDWWYERQEALCKKMLQRMRELGMQPVIPGFSGQVPNCIVNYSIDGFNKVDVINSGSWAGGYTRPDIVKPDTESYRTLAAAYYKHLHNVMGVSELYSIDPFHEGGLPRWDSNRDGKIDNSDSYITNAECYPPIMKELDNYYSKEETQTVREEYNALAEQPKWIIQYWQNIPQGGAFTEMKKAGYTNRFIGLDLFADNIYADNAAKWRTNYYDTCPYVYCMLHNFGGRSGMHGRLETTMNGYFEALAKGNNCQGIGATPEGTETNPILYDMLFELPWMDPATRPSADEWLEDYAYSRYGIQNSTALSALQNLKKSVWNCQRNQQGTSEAIILGRPRWTFGDAQRNDGTSLEGRSVSSWSVSSIYWDTQDVLLAADDLYSIKDLITTEDGRANFDYDFIEVVRQAMVDQASVLLPLIKVARNNGDTAEYERLYKMFLQLMLDLDEMLSYDENFKLERWTSLARNIANEAAGTNANDRNWLEWNARTQVTVWSNGNNGLNDYSNRCWAGLIKDFHYPRWKYFFENNGGVKDGNWFTSEKAWTVNFTDYDYSTVTIPGGKTATEKAAETFGNYFGRVRGATKNYIFPMGITTNATKCDVTPTVNRGQTVELPLIIGKNVTISSVWVDLNNDGAKGNGETLTANGNNVTLPADAKIGKTTAQVVYSDGTDITFSLALVENISEERTVTAVASANGSVAIEGADGLTVTNKEAVKITATANTGYNFEKWTDAAGNVVSNDNPYIYYGKEAATFTANFIQNKWGVVECAPDKDDYTGEVKDEAAVMTDVSSNNQYIHNLTLSYYNREAETIYEPATAPTSIFTTIPQIVNVPQGASFTVEYDKGIGNGFQHCYFRAYIDLNADGDFDDEGELLKEVGTKGAQNAAVCSNSINVLLPYTIPLGITHMRLRFDSAWNIGDGAKAKSVRPVYDLVINVTEGSDKAAHITVASNNDAWGTAKVWTEETPGWTASNEWNVSTGIYANIKAVKASEDVEFLGWYDQYGRLLTNELEYSMLAREDATYTARFRKALDIDGWEFKYRTEPGDELRVKGTLAKGVKPENGKKYYIAAHTLSSGTYYNRYLYDNGGILATNTTADLGNYVWTCIVNDNDTYSFRNASGKYLSINNANSNGSNYSICIGSTVAEYTFDAAKHEGVALLNAYSGKSSNVVTKHDGTAFDRWGGTVNNGSWSNDYIFVELTTPDVVILTSVRKSGDHDLVIPETVEILGEQCKVVGFDNNLFANNKDLWSISLPSTIKTLSSNVLFCTSVKGENTPTSSGDTNPDNKVQVIDLGFTLKNSEAWSIRATYKSDGVSTFNQWGSPLLYPNGNGTDTELFFLSNVNNWSSCWHVRSPFSGLGNDYFKDLTNTKIATFTALLENKGTGKAVITVTNSEGQSKTSSEVAFSYDNISAFSAKLPKGLDITGFEVLSGVEPDPFEGCTNLLDITIANGKCNGGYTVDGREFKNASGVVLHTLADAAKKDAIRTLSELIDSTKALMDVIATSVNPTGKATEIALTTTQGSENYIWCNAPQSGDEGNVGLLLDNTASTFFHSNWGSTTAPADGLDHHLTIENIKGIGDLKFHYQARTGSRLGDYPTTIRVQGSNNGTDYTDIATVQPRNANGGTIENGAEWTSEKIGDGNRYTYLRFMVTTTTTNKKKDGHVYWHMAEFDLFKLTSTVEVATKYKNLVGITNDEAANVYDNLVNALYVYNNGGTAAELQAAYDVLDPLYKALNAKKDKVLNGYYHIYFMDGENEVPTFISYNDENIYGNYGDSSDWGYKIVAKGVYVTDADGVFAIVPSGNGYTISAQGKYLKSPVFNDWKHIQFSDNEDDAGAYLFEKETGLDVFKIKADGDPIDNGVEWVVHNPYLQFYNPQSTGKLVLGNTDTQNSGSSFKLVSATSYTITIPESGFLPLCLPFNVVLPEGVEACDIHELSKEKLMMGSEGLFTTIATAGQIVKAGTPVILKGTASASYALGITLNNNGAKTSLPGSVLRGNYVKQTLAEGTKRFMLNGAGDAFEGHETAVNVPANSCWIEADIEDASIDLIQKPSYTVTLSSKGYLPLYLPLNVVLPDGVTAYDINDLSKDCWLKGDTEGGLLKQIAVSGDILKARTAVILKGTAEAKYELTKTLNEEGAKGSLEGSLLRGSLTTQAILPSDGVRKYVFSTTMGDMFDMLEANTQIPANSCWIEMVITAENEEYLYEDIDLIPNFITIGDIDDGWKFRVKNTGKGITITDCMSSGTDSLLIIGSTYEVDGVTKEVIGVTDYFLDGNLDVKEVTLPATLTSVGTGYANPMFDITYQGADYGVGKGIGEPDGEGKVAEDAAAAEAAAWMGQSHIFPNRTKVYGASTWRMTVGVKIAENAGSFNKWGSCLLATKEYTLANDYSDGSMQVYLRADRRRVVFKLDSDGDRDEFGLTNAEGYKADSLTFIFENDGAGGYKIKVKFEGGVTEEREIIASDHAELHDFNTVWSSLGEGITVNVKFEKLTTHGLFVGCKNLTAIHVAEGNESFHGCEHGVLYNYNKNHVIRFPEGGGHNHGDHNHGSDVFAERHFEVPREVTRVYAGALHGVEADIIFHSNPSIMHVEGHEEHVKAKYYLRIEDDAESIDLAANLNTFQNIKYKRAVQKTKIDANGENKKMFYSVILPFKPAAEDLAPYEFYRFSRADEQGIDFSEVVAEDVEANVPYLFAVRDSHSEDDFETAITAGAEPHTLGWHNDTVAMKHGDWVVVGCYSNEVIDVVNGNNGKNKNYYFYGVSSVTNKLVRVTNSIKTKPYRMFFVNTRPVNSNGVALARQLNLRLINGSTTEITPEQIDGWGETEPIYYDLQGRRVLNPENGIYIVNGKKVVL